MAGPTVEGQTVAKSMVMDYLGKFKSMTRDKFNMEMALDPLSDQIDLSEITELPFSTVFDTIFLGKNPELVGKWRESLTRFSPRGRARPK